MICYFEEGQLFASVGLLYQFLQPFNMADYPLLCQKFGSDNMFKNVNLITHLSVIFNLPLLKMLTNQPSLGVMYHEGKTSAQSCKWEQLWCQRG